MARNVPTPSGAEIIDVMLLRKAIGVLGVALPFLLWFGGLAARVALQPSISRYYHTQMHDVFVGVLCAIGLGLFAYRGYLHPKKKKWWENRVANVAAAFAVGTAIFAPGEGSAFWNEIIPLLRIGLNNFLHHLCAILFIVILAWFAWQFSKGKYPRFYRGCAAVILVAGAVAVLHAIGVHFIPNGVFLGEAFAVWGFGVAWFVKGWK